MMGQSHFQRIFVDHVGLVALFIRAEFGSSDRGGAFVLCLSGHRPSVSDRARVMV
ncbi:hypothetical protein [Bartonella raoultii]|uniref:hypothetical protein n=1 Tax=Bartonella raoultii TaxID=1457020 RepID=UPI001ABBBCFE|nr:hypothetical protein [Bartonella raoultii]